MNQVHTNSGIFISVMPGARMFSTVAMMLMEPMMDEKPSMCTAKMKKSVLFGAKVVDSGA